MAVRKHGTGTANNVVTVSDLGTAAAEGANRQTATAVEVVSVSGTAPIYFTVNGSTPTVAGDDTHVCQTGGSVRVPARGALPVTVKLISAADFTYSAEVLSE